MDNSKTILAKNIRYLMEQKQKTRTELCEALGVKYTTLSDWVNGKTYPRIDKIERMAAYFGVEKSALLEDRRHPLYPSSDKANPHCWRGQLRHAPSGRG